MTSVEPKEGGIAGGTRVTISGSGFGDTAADVKISLGDVLCDVISVNVSTVVCITGSNTAGNKTMNVSLIISCILCCCLYFYILL